MDEKKLLENFAKAIGAENVLKELEEKKANDAILLEKKKIKEAALLESMNNALTKLTAGEKLTVEKAFEKPVSLIEVVSVGEPAPKSKSGEPKPIPLGAQPLPQLPQKDIVTRSVEAISQKARDEYVAAVDAVPDSIRKELDILKKTVTDLHRFASRASQMGGGGEVNLRYLDDIDRSTITPGHFLTYDSNKKKFIFSQIAEGNIDLSHIDQNLTPSSNGVYNLGLSTNYWNTVYANSIAVPNGSLITSTLIVSPVIDNANLDHIVAYSTNSSSIPIGTYGNLSEIPAPWSVYQLTTIPSPVLQVNDLVAGTGVPLNNHIAFIGTGAYANIIISNTTFTVAPPANGTILTITRDVINPSLSLTTIANTNIALTPGSNGIIVVNSDIIPVTTNTNRLGTPAKRFRELWLGPGTLYVADESLGVDQALGANNGNFYIKGGAGFNVGEFTLRDNQIAITNPSRDILFGTTLATGNVVFNRPIVVKSADTGKSTFKVSREGLVNITTPNTILTTQASLSITGANSEVSQPRNFTGTLIQGTAQDGQPARVGFDAFGANTYVAIAGRGARGTVQSPSGTQANDTIMRLSMQGWTTDGNAYAGSIGRINMQAAETFYTANSGTKITFQLTPTGSNTIQAETIAFTANGINFTNNPYGAIKFNDGSIQNTAFNDTSAVTKINVGTGLTQSGTVGIVGIDSNAVLTITGTANQVNVSNVGGNYTLSLPQNIGTNSIVQFGTLTVNNFNVTGATTSAETLSISDKLLHLAYDSTSDTQIDGGGITLGNSSSSYVVSILYNLANNSWNTGTTNLITKNLSANSITANVGIFNGQLHAGAQYLTIGYDFPNATFQGDCNTPSYNQVVTKNHSASTQASADFVAVNDIGTDSNNYIDMGINSSTYANSSYSMGGPNDGYLYVNGGNLDIATQTVNKNIQFFTGNTTSDALRATINSTGLAVTGNVSATYFTGSLIGNANTASYIGTLPAANVVSNNQLSSNLANYQTTAGLSGNVATLTSNSANYIGTLPAANVVSNNQLSSNLANYQTTAGLSANVAKLAANSTTYVLANSGIVSNSYGVFVNTAYIATLTSNSANYIGTLPAANVVSNSQLSSNLANYALLAGATFTGNVVVNANLTTNSIFTVGNSSVNTVISNSTVTTANLTSKYFIANGSPGSSKQVLMSGGNSANVYWQWPNQHFALGANLSLNATSTSAQSLFGVGVQVANNSRYAISMIGTMTSTGGGPAGAGKIGFGFGGTANLASVYYQTTTVVSDAEAAAAAPDLSAFRLTSNFIANSSVNQVTNFNKAYMIFNVQGIISVANSGTLIPQYDTDHASTTLTLLASSSVSLELLGDDGVANSVTGTWA